MSNMSKCFIEVLVSKRQDDLWGYRFFYIPYTYSNERSVPIYADMVKGILMGYMPANKDYTLSVSYTYGDLTCGPDDEVTSLSDLIRTIPDLKLYAEKKVVSLKKVRNEYDEMVSVHMGHWNNVRLEYSSKWDNTFLHIDLPNGYKRKGNSIKEKYRKEVVQSLFKDYYFGISVYGDPYVKGNFRIERDYFKDNPVIAIYKKESEIDFQKVVNTETVEL